MNRRLPVTPPWTLAVTAMLSVQLGSALSPHLIATVGSAGTAWLRLSIGAALFLPFAGPALRAVTPGDVPTLLGLGVTTGLQTTAFLAAIERIPLGTCVAIEFLGPLTVAALASRSARALSWLALALGGVALLTQPWAGTVDAAGIGLALAAAVGWASYIVLTQRIGDRFIGLSALAVTTPLAALTAAVIGIPQAAGHLSLGVIAASAGLAMLLPVIPYGCELLALRRMTSTAFGTLMAVEPAIGLVLGWIILTQTPSPIQLGGLMLVVLAGAAAQRGGRRHPPTARPRQNPQRTRCHRLSARAPAVAVPHRRWQKTTP